MRLQWLAACTLMAVFTSVAHADEWNKTYQISGPPEMKVTASDAAIEVQAWDKNTVEVQIKTENIKIGSSALKITERQDGNRIEIELRDERHVRFGLHIGDFHEKTNVIVHLPRKATLSAHTGDGRIRVTGIEGNLSCESGDGRIDIDSVAGNLNARTGDGRLVVNGRFEQLDLKTGDGSIVATALPGSHIARDWNLHTGDGHVTLKLPSNFAADLDVHTSDGHIDLGFPVPVSGRVDRQSVRGKLNGGGGLVTVRSGDGSISLESSGATM